MCKRFQVDMILETSPVRMQVDHDYIVELINDGKSVSDVTIDIYDNQRKTIYGNGKELTLKEVVDLLNDYDNENIELKKENQKLHDMYYRILEFLKMELVS